MRCWIYRSSRKADTYLYLARSNQFDELPQILLQTFGTPVFVMELDLRPERQLAQEDPVQVIDNLRRQGFHLQLPPPSDPVL